MMKDYSNYLSDKPFACNVDGCSMKFTNEDHLTVHKKRHDMTLTLGLGPKGTTFVDQTPTPTQFIRNCEEVGLFQDLQNVNPFEEIFKKAVEAVKAGQPITLGKSFQSNPPDDTLHTPNVFPHITDVPSINHPDNCLRSENIPSCEDGLLKPDVTESGKICSGDITTDCSIQPSVLTQPITESPAPAQSIGSPENHSVRENKVILNVPEGHFVQLITPDTSPNPCNMVVIKNSVDNNFPSVPLTVKDKLKKNLSEKKSGKYLQQKVPILKCPAKRTSNLLSQKFSKFSKNALKLISKLENSNMDLNEVVPRKQKKMEKFQSKESRSEFLARSRAASSRCREKKKMYVLYLEKVNSELSTANQNLQLINTLLRKKICDLHAELLKHKNCSAADKSTEAALSAVATFIGEKSPAEEKTASEVTPPTQPNPEAVTEFFSPSKPDIQPSEILPESKTPADVNSFSFDVAEVVLDDGGQDNEIPLGEGSKPPDIIVRFNSVNNDLPAKLPLDSHFNCYIEGAGEHGKQIYSEHSYYYKKPVDVEKRIINYKTFRDTIGAVSPISSDDCKKLENLRLKKSDAFRDITSLNAKVLLEPKTPPPLLLLKPFKKRSLQNKQNEKT